MTPGAGDDAFFNQIEIPASFIALFVPPGRIKPTEPRSFIAERYEFCEDLAQMLVDMALEQKLARCASDSEVLARIQAGLRSDGQPVSIDEAGWVARRLAELLGWPWEPSPT
jgi:hypothetical protein